jgi:hypothetical protein
MEAQANPAGAGGPPAGWHADPQGAAPWRYWDGGAWTRRTAPAWETGWPSIRQAAGHELVLHQAGFAGTDELKLGEQLFAQMQKPLAGDTTGHSADGSWLFDRKGIVVSRVEVYALPARALVAKYDWDDLFKRAGTLRFPDGRAFRWDCTDEPEYDPGVVSLDILSDGLWTFHAAGGRPVVSGRLGSLGRAAVPTSGRTAAPISVVIPSEASTVPELPMLALLSSYLVWEWTIQLQNSLQ